MSKYSLLAKMGADTTQFKRAMQSTSKQTSAFGKQMMKMGGMLAGVFGTQQIIRYGKELFELGNKVIGVQKAFDNLNKPTLLNELRQATSGTVDDLKLMQAAVQAKNFKIPLDQLATYFKFATIRAKETGESVDYLVKSLIMGMGRKSALIMDNLGISAKVLQDEVKKTGDFAKAAGKIITEELGQMSDGYDETYTGAEKLNTSIENLSIAIGEKLAPAINKAASETASLLDITTDIVQTDNLEWWEKLAGIFSFTPQGRGAIVALDAVRQKQKETNQEKENAINLTGKSLDVLKEEQKSLIKYIETLNHTSPLYESIASRIQDYADAIIKARDALKKLNDEQQKIRDARAADAVKFTAPSIGPDGMQIKNPIEPGKKSKRDDIGDWKKKMLEDLDNMDDFENRMEKMIENANGMLQSFTSDVIGTFAENIGAALVTGTAGLENAMYGILAMFGDFLSQMGRMIIGYGIAMEGFKKAFEKPWVAIAAGIALVAIGGAIKSFASQGPEMPALAEGGLAYGPTAAIVGDNPRASVDPEVIAPLSKLQGLTGGGISGKVIFEIGGDKLKGVLRKYDNRYAITN